MPQNPYRTIEYVCIHLLYDTIRGEFGGRLKANPSRWEPDGYDRPLQFSKDPNVVYEELQEELGMAMANLLERMRNAPTLF